MTPRSNVGAGIFGILGAFLALQATRVQFVFEDKHLEVLIKGTDTETEVSPASPRASAPCPRAAPGARPVGGLTRRARLLAPQNAFVGGRNRWAYDTFVNWELWWPGFPVLVYFKETQTKPEGQIHFFPVIFNGQQLYDVMVERCGNSQGSLPK